MTSTAHLSTAHLSPAQPHAPSARVPARVPAQTSAPSTGAREEDLDPSPTREVVAELAALAQLPPGADPVREQELREQLVHQHLALASSMAGRYRDRGVALEDLRQVAHLGLTKASQRFDATAGHRFTAFCAPTIRGELRRHFRDLGWAVRPPRRVQELQARLTRAGEELAFQLDRTPSEQELADHLDVTAEDVREAQSAQGCFQPSSLDRPVGDPAGEGAGGGASLGDLLPAEQDLAAGAEARAVLGPHVRALDERDRRILELRFFHDLTQREIAEDIGVTQMQVSRLITRILRDLRRSVGPVED